MIFKSIGFNSIVLAIFALVTAVILATTNDLTFNAGGVLLLAGSSSFLGTGALTIDPGAKIAVSSAAGFTPGEADGLRRSGQPPGEVQPRHRALERLAAATGALGEAKAALNKYQKDVDRLTPLAQRRAIPQQDLDNALASVDVGEAGRHRAAALTVVHVIAMKAGCQPLLVAGVGQ